MPHQPNNAELWKGMIFYVTCIAIVDTLFFYALPKYCENHADAGICHTGEPLTPLDAALLMGGPW